MGVAVLPDPIVVKVHTATGGLGDFRNVFDVDFGPGVDTLGAVNKYSSFLMKYSYCGSNTMFNFTSCDSVVLPDTTYNVSVNFANEYLDINGCDSNVFNHISIGILPDVSIAGCDSGGRRGLPATGHLPSTMQTLPLKRVRKLSSLAVTGCSPHYPAAPSLAESHPTCPPMPISNGKPSLQMCGLTSRDKSFGPCRSPRLWLQLR